MSIESILQPYQQLGVNLGLERIQRLLAQLGNPQEQVPILHVAGTNGKGSVCAYLSSVLVQAGYRVGRYISPHLVDWCERISINQVWISPDDFVQMLEIVVAAIDPTAPPPTQFEIITAAAWLYFAQQQADIAVIEVGLGGRLDATNVCDRPLATVITSISREHWQVLGSTIAEIAGEKAGILKPGCPAFIGRLPTEAKAVVVAKADLLNSSVTWVEPAIAIAPPVPFPQSANSVRWVEAQGIQYPITLQGDFQLANSALAIAVIQSLRQQGWPISDAALQEGMRQAQWPGRLQLIAWQDYPLLIDGAHNPAAAQGLRQFVDQAYPQQTITWVMGMLSTKDHREVFTALLKPGDRLLLVPVPDHNSAEPGTLAAIAQSVCPSLAICQTYPQLQAALSAAFPPPNPTSDPVVLCGSLYLIGHFLGTFPTAEMAQLSSTFWPKSID